jgi:type IV pilus assembly protein PilA
LECSWAIEVSADSFSRRHFEIAPFWPVGTPRRLFDNRRMTSRRPPSAGFTLIELMVVVSIIAILALLAVPSLRDSLMRQQVADALPLVDFAKKAVAAQYAASAAFPADNAQAGVPPADRIVSRHVRSVEVRNGVLVMTFGNQAMGGLAGSTLSLRPAYVDGYPQVPISWLCGSAPVPANMRVQGNNETSLPEKFLPRSCRH